MDAVKVGLAVQHGLSIVCATCERYWQGHELGTKCVTPGVCGSPLVGLTFPYYKGPITDFSRWCFVCGAGATAGVSVARQPRVFGICRQHIRYFSELEPRRGMDEKARRRNGVNVVEIIANGVYTPIGHFCSTLSKTLGQVIGETEAKWAAKSS